MAVIYDRDHALLLYRDLGELPPSRYATAGSDVWLTGDATSRTPGQPCRVLF